MEPTTPTKRADLEAVIDAAKSSVEIDKRIRFIGDDYPVAIVRQGESIAHLETILDLRDSRAERPRRREGTATLHELASFIEHVNRHKDGASVIFANLSAPSLTVIFDYHEAGASGKPRWGKHRAIYQMPLARQWMLWMRANTSKMTQEAFAQFIEDNLDDLRAPDEKGVAHPSEVLTMARNLVIHSKGEFSRQLHPVTGESALIVKHENEATSTKIPPAFLLGIPVFEAGAAYAIKARLRLDMTGGRPQFSYALYQPEAIARHAFDEVRKVAKEKTALPVFAGVPEDE